MKDPASQTSTASTFEEADGDGLGVSVNHSSEQPSPGSRATKSHTVKDPTNQLTTASSVATANGDDLGVSVDRSFEHSDASKTIKNVPAHSNTESQILGGLWLPSSSAMGSSPFPASTKPETVPSASAPPTDKVIMVSPLQSAAVDAPTSGPPGLADGSTIVHGAGSPMPNNDTDISMAKESSGEAGRSRGTGSGTDPGQDSLLGSADTESMGPPPATGPPDGNTVAQATGQNAIPEPAASSMATLADDMPVVGPPLASRPASTPMAVEPPSILGLQPNKETGMITVTKTYTIATTQAVNTTLGPANMHDAPGKPARNPGSFEESLATAADARATYSRPPPHTHNESNAPENPATSRAKVTDQPPAAPTAIAGPPSRLYPPAFSDGRLVGPAARPAGGDDAPPLGARPAVASGSSGSTALPGRNGDGPRQPSRSSPVDPPGKLRPDGYSGEHDPPGPVTVNGAARTGLGARTLVGLAVALFLL